MQIPDPAAIAPSMKATGETPMAKGVGDFGKMLLPDAAESPVIAFVYPAVEEATATPNVAELLPGPELSIGEEELWTSPAIPDAFMAASQLEDPDALPGDVLYPWQLVAQAAMSQLGQMAYGQAMRVQEPMIGLGGHAVGKTETAAPGLSAAASPWTMVLGPTESQAAPAAIAAGTAARIESAKRGSAAISTEEAAPVLGAWLERIQRRVENAEGQATVWLRDYRSDGASQASIINDIIAFYGPAKPVWRIVVNGSEIWRRPSIQPGEG
ncbi:hypothetical protein CQ393_02350 [Stenotrophomonas sp. MYb238]|uniref:hypothetical protein n=1 Tax=Stenotrophomonas sp. MYb238 TaxID=2040281 RepID=UPI00129098E1|nr:hypothetical protein [Stenotrophomonas sp. MYb238]MQP74733.1 hypothetical protein [Stenotrophomonas sp. MYb238]